MVSDFGFLGQVDGRRKVWTSSLFARGPLLW